MLSQSESLFAAAETDMRILWGEIDIHSETMPFRQTTYYEKEMGAALLKKFVSFTPLIDPGQLAAVKHQSNHLETQLAQTDPAQAIPVPRPINLDPGYIDPGKLVLATTKNYSHRIYIGDSMYAEATLHFHKGTWQSWPYTYPDYAGENYHDFLNRTRQRLMEQLSSLNQNI